MKPSKCDSNVGMHFEEYPKANIDYVCSHYLGRDVCAPDQGKVNQMVSSYLEELLQEPTCRKI
jgi:hypothetical protein